MCDTGDDSGILSGLFWAWCAGFDASRSFGRRVSFWLDRIDVVFYVSLMVFGRNQIVVWQLFQIAAKSMVFSRACTPEDSDLSH